MNKGSKSKKEFNEAIEFQRHQLAENLAFLIVQIHRHDQRRVEQEPKAK